MEDILASIRRIIADDQSRQGIAAPPRPSARPPGAADPSSAAPDPAAKRPTLTPPPAASSMPRPGSSVPVAAAPPMTRPPVEARMPVPPAKPAAPPAPGPAVNGHAPHLNPPLLSDLSVFEEIASVGAATVANAERQPAPATPNGHVAEPAAVQAPAPVIILPAPQPLPPSPGPATPPEPVAEAGQAGSGPAPESDRTEATPVAEIVEPVAAPATPMPAAEPLVSAQAVAAIEHSFQALATSIFMQNAGQLDAVVRDLLRPMLKGWLDDNLPAIVERLVRTEIERVARGGRG